MRVAAGIIAQAPQVVGAPGASLVHFTLALDRLGDTALLDAGHASPGRYVGEMLRRLRGFFPGADLYLACNPWLELPPGLVENLVWRAGEIGAVPRPGGAAFWIFADTAGRPLAYALRGAEVDDCPALHLALLASDDAGLDARLLAASLGPGEVRVVDPARGVVAPGNRFVPIHPALHHATEQAIALLEGLPPGARREALHTTERAALVGYHAGDVLFTLEGLAQEQTPFRAVAVVAPYADIVEYVTPQWACLAAPQPIPFRAGYHPGDEYELQRGYMEQLLRDGAAPPRFWHFLRPVFRDYNRTRHHLREAVAFAVGGRGHRLRPLPPLGACQEDYRRAVPRPGRVVVHFEAGWSLKEFPADQRAELLHLLRHEGYEPVLLGKPEPACPEVAAQPYTGLAAFRALLDSAVAFLGGDSFPAHFANLYGVPTVHHFGCTRPQNARGLESPRYRVLHHPVPCTPCYQQVICPLDGTNTCRAHPAAGEMMAALHAVAPPRRTQERA